MTKHKVMRHGEQIKPHYRPAPGHTESSAGQSSDAQRKDGEMSGIVKRYSKRKRASTTPVAMGWIKSIRDQAVEYTGSPQELRGMLLLWGMFAAGGAAIFFPMGVTAAGWGGWFFGLLGVGFATASFAFGFCMLLWSIRLELFRPVDEPTLFDRHHRKVYRIFREMQPGIKGLFKRWPLRAAEYEWDLIDVEHQTKLTTTGSTVTRYHALVFLVRKSADDPSIIDSFTIGNPMLLGEQSVPAVWEHIRRFMEENGPPLPPGEALAPSELPQTLWQSLGAVGPFGPKYGQWWKNQPMLMVLFHVVFPLFVPMFVLWGIFNWLSYKTATPIEWPEEVAERVGAVQIPGNE